MKYLTFLFVLLVGCNSRANTVVVKETVIVESTIEVERVVKETIIVEATVEVESRDSAELKLIETPQPIPAELNSKIFYQGTPITISVPVLVHPISGEIVEVLSSAETPTTTPTTDDLLTFDFVMSDFRPNCISFVDHPSDRGGARLCERYRYLDAATSQIVTANVEVTSTATITQVSSLLRTYSNDPTPLARRCNVPLRDVWQRIQQESGGFIYTVNESAHGVLQEHAPLWSWSFYQTTGVAFTDPFGLDAQIAIMCMLTVSDEKSSGDPWRQWSKDAYRQLTVSAEAVPVQSPTAEAATAVSAQLQTQTPEIVRPITPTAITSTETLTATARPITSNVSAEETPVPPPPSIYDVTSTPVVFSEPVRVESSSLSVAAKQTVSSFGCQFVVNIGSGGGWLCVTRFGVDLPPLPLPVIAHDVQRVIREAHPYADYRWFDREALAFGAYAVNVFYFNHGDNPWNIETNKSAALSQYESGDFWKFPWSRIQLQP